MMCAGSLGVRWTVGDVSPRGFEALRLSLWGARKVFGPSARYAVCVNSIDVGAARAQTGDVPPEVHWHNASRDFPEFLDNHFDHRRAEGVGWKFAPLRFFPDRFELALDNDCILWECPQAVRQWLENGDPHRCVAAEDVRALFGKFAPLCGPQPRNGGLRGMPPGLELDAVLRRLLQTYPVVMTSELDEQGLTIAALSETGAPLLVTLDEVTICSPFPPHEQKLGRCGAHFCGLNAREFSWSIAGRNAALHIADHWQRHRPALYANVNLTLPESVPQ